LKNERRKLRRHSLRCARSFPPMNPNWPREKTFFFFSLFIKHEPRSSQPLSGKLPSLCLHLILILPDKRLSFFFFSISIFRRKRESPPWALSNLDMAHLCSRGCRAITRRGGEERERGPFSAQGKPRKKPREADRLFARETKDANWERSRREKNSPSFGIWGGNKKKHSFSLLQSLIDT